MQMISTTTMRTLAWLALASGVVVSLPAAAEAPATGLATPGPHEVIADLSSRLFATLGPETAAVRHSPELTLPLIDNLLAPHFDVDYTARLVLGRHWNAASPQQRERFAAAFYQRLLRTYVGAVADWTPDRVKLLPLQADPAALQVTVHTVVTKPGDTDARVDYRLRISDAGWRVFDVVVDGVSYAHSYYGDVDADVARNGVDAATARLARNDVGVTAQPATAPRRRQ